MSDDDFDRWISEDTDMTFGEWVAAECPHAIRNRTFDRASAPDGVLFLADGHFVVDNCTFL